MATRDARPAEIEPLARLWCDAWHEAHAALVPAPVVAARTPESFAARLREGLGAVRVTGPVGDPTGLCIVAGDELNQLFVAPRARGAGAALALERDARRRLREGGASRAWLVCARGNDRAAAFYERCRWRRIGTVVHDLRSGDAAFPCEVWRHERRLPAREVSVRALGPDEWALHRALRLRALADSPDAFGATLEEAAARPESSWRDRLRDARPGIDLPLLAEVDGRPAGIAWGRRDPADGPVVHVYQMWVAPEGRGRGAGERLLDAVIDWAGGLGARRVELAVTRGNAAAERLYRAAGFAALGGPVPMSGRPGLEERHLRLELPE